MKRGNIWGVAMGLGLTTFAGVASAQEAAPAASPDGHASGVMVQGRLQAQGGLLSLGGGPSFLLGYQAPSFALGLGLGLNRISVASTEAGGDVDGSLTLFQVMPTAIVDVWHSADGRARANLIGGIGYGRASLSTTTNGEDCMLDAMGNEVCTSTKQEASVGAGFVPFMLGFGGDYYLSRNFALGAEVGLQAAFTTGISADEDGTSRDIGASGNLQLAYGALRATFVLGN